VSVVLEATGVSVSFGGVKALDDVDIEVREGQLVGLIGPNGAGKTTFIDAVTGFVPAAGRMLLDGIDLSALPPHARARQGLARTWQTIELFDDLSVGKNLEVSAEHPSLWQSVKGAVWRPPPLPEAVHDALRLLDIESMIDARPGDLPQGQRKLVGVARALAARPRLLLLDEPAAGLDTTESEDLGRRLRRVVDSGIATLLIDHDMGLVLSICDYIVVLDFGRVIARGTPDDVRRDPTVVAAYLGGASTELQEAR
jgi:branched-chain amino acid transport system ATP-binding protein